MSVSAPTTTPGNGIDGAFLFIIPSHAPAVFAYVGGCEGVLQEARLIFLFVF